MLSRGIGTLVASLLGLLALGSNVTAQTIGAGIDYKAYQRIPATDFAPANAKSGCGFSQGTQALTNWDPGSSHFTYQLLTQDSATCNNFVVAPRLPGGALLSYIALDSCGNPPFGHVTLTVYDCDNLGNCNSTPLTTLSSPNGGGCGREFDPSLAYTVDNLNRELVLNVHIDSPDPSAGGQALAGVVLGYTLQVSPAPAAAFFADVPVSH